MRYWLWCKIGSSTLVYIYLTHVNTFFSRSIYWTWEASCIWNCIWNCIKLSNCGGFDHDHQVLLDAIKKKTYDEELRREDLLMNFRRQHVHGVNSVVSYYLQFMFLIRPHYISQGLGILKNPKSMFAVI